MKWYFLLFVLLLGCRKEGVDKGLEVSVSLQQIEEAGVLPWGVLFDSLEVSKSIDVDRLPLWRIKHVLQAGDYWVVVTSEELVLTSRKDTSSYVYRRVGQGPGEYMNLEDAVYDEENQRLLVLTGYPNRILTFRLPCTYVSEYTLPNLIMWERLFLQKGDLYIFGENYDENSKNSYDVFCRHKDDALSRMVTLAERKLMSSADYWTITTQGQNLLIGMRERDSLFQIDTAMHVEAIPLMYSHERLINTEKVHNQQLLYANDKMLLFTRTLPKGILRRFCYSCESAVGLPIPFIKNRLA